MTQQAIFPICDCCGLPIIPGSGNDCPRCQYPIKPDKEARFLETSLHDLQRIANHGGGDLTVKGLIARYRRRLNYLRVLQTGLAPQAAAATRPAPPATPPVVSQQQRPTPSSVFQESKPTLLPVTPPVVPVPVFPPAQPSLTPALPLPAIANATARTPVAPLETPQAAPEPAAQRPARRDFASFWRSFVVDQAITIIGLLGAFLILMGALSSVVTTGADPTLSFLIVFGVHAFFGLAGMIAFRFANFKLLARIYSGVYVLLVPLVGFTGYNLLLGAHLSLSVATLIMIAALYAAIVYILLAVYQKFAVYGYLGAMALIVADLALAADLHLGYFWWPSMLMALALPAQFSILRSPATSSERFFTDTLAVLRQPVRVTMYTIVAVCLISAVTATSISLLRGSISVFPLHTPPAEIRYAILSMAVLLLAWTTLWFWLLRRTRGLLVLALLLLANVLAFCYAFDFSRSGYGLALAGVALLYHGLNRFAPRLIQPMYGLGLSLDRIALLLVCLAPLICSPLLLPQLFFAAYNLPFSANSDLYVQANGAAVAELIAVGIGCGITLSMGLLRARPRDMVTNWSWLLLLSGILLTWELSTVVLALKLVPIWYFAGLTLAFVVLAVLVRERFAPSLANTIDALALGESALALSLSLKQGADSVATLLLAFAALSLAVVIYQRRQRWLFLTLIFTTLALAILLIQRPYVALLIAGLLPFVAVALRAFLARVRPVGGMDDGIMPVRAPRWEWPLLATALLYGATACFIDMLVANDGRLPQSSIGAWLGIAFPVVLELAALSLLWYLAAALARVKEWLLPTIAFAAWAVLLPYNPFWVLAVVIPMAALLGLAISLRFARAWASPLYIVALLSAVMTGVIGHQYPEYLLATSWILPGFGLLAYLISLFEGFEVGLWLLPTFSIWGLVDMSQLGDFYRPPMIVLLYAGVGVAIGLLPLVRLPFPGTLKRQDLLRYALPFYAAAFAAALSTGLNGSLPDAKSPFYGALPDALLLYALVTFGVLLFERQARWLWLVAGFAVWSVLLATQLSVAYVGGIGLGVGVLGVILSQVIRQKAVNVASSSSYPTPLRLSWSWPWYLASLIAALAVSCWPLFDAQVANLAEDMLLAFAALAYIAGISEDFVLLLWVAPLLATLSLGYSAAAIDTTRLLVVALVFAGLGIAASSLKFSRRFVATGRKSLTYALPFHAMALIAALLTGLDGTFSGAQPLFYFVVLLTYALIAYAIALFERQPAWLLIVAGFAVWTTLLTSHLTAYYVAGIAIAAGIAGILTGRLIRKPTVDRTAPQSAQRWQQFTWSWPWYATALVAAVMTGLWPYQPATVQPIAGFIDYCLLGFAVLFYGVALVEDRSEVLWIGSFFAGWSLVDSALGNDFPRLLFATLVYTILGVAISNLRWLPAFARTGRAGQISRYTLPFYMVALTAALLSSLDSTMFTLHTFVSGNLPDVLPLLVYAGIAFGVLLIEQQPRWLILVVGFGAWALLLTPRTSIMWVIGIAIGGTLVGLLSGRVLNPSAAHTGETPRAASAAFVWSWPWYLIAVLAMLWTLVWQLSLGGTSQTELVAYSFLIYAALTACVMLVERVPETLIFPALFAALAILFWQPPLAITAQMIAFTILCALIFASQLVWKRIASLTKGIPAMTLHSIAAIGGQFLVIRTIISNGGLFSSSGLLAFVGAGSLLVLALMIWWYGRLQAHHVVRHYCDYGAGLLGALAVTWTLAAFGQTNLDLLTLAPATYLTIIAPMLLRDETVPERRILGEAVAVLGAALLLLPTLWLSFSGSAENLGYTLILLIEALALLLLGIGAGMRIFFLTGTGLIVVAALHALFLPSLGIPTPLALTILGAMLLGIATALSLVRHRLRTAWSQWE